MFPSKISYEKAFYDMTLPWMRRWCMKTCPKCQLTFSDCKRDRSNKWHCNIRFCEIFSTSDSSSNVLMLSKFRNLLITWTPKQSDWFRQITWGVERGQSDWLRQITWEVERGWEWKEAKKGVERGQISLFCPSASRHLSCDLSDVLKSPWLLVM